MVYNYELNGERVKYYKYVKIYLHGRYIYGYMEEIMALREDRQSVDNHTIV